MKSLSMILGVVCLGLLVAGSAAAAGPFGPPQPLVKETAGLHTGIGYWYQEDLYENGLERVTRQNQLYSELGYGGDRWEITGRVGMSDLKLIDAFHSSTAATTTSRKDFEERWKFFTTLGAKGFYPFNKTFGLGAFIQGTYYFSDFTDAASGSQGGAPFLVEVAVKNVWDANVGMGFQVTFPRDIKFYLGPTVHYSEFKVSSSRSVAGIALAAGETTLRNKARFGGYTGIEVPLAKGFRLNLEGQYTERLSGGAAILYVY